MGTDSDDKAPKSEPRMFKSEAQSGGSGMGRLLILGGALVVVIAVIVYFNRAGTTPQGEVPPPPSADKPPPKPDVVKPGAMASIAGGAFTMGGTEGDADEKPPHEVKVKPFELDLTEVRVSDYKACVDAGKCAAPLPGLNCNYQNKDNGEHPINCIDATMAADYCKFVGKRLPTEEEWEFAARADGRMFVFNAPPKDQLCWNGEGNDLGKGNRHGTCPVASYPAGKSPAGIYDLAGNVWEWTATPYCPYDKPDCGDEQRVIRGGAWNNLVPSYVRAADRAKQKPTDRVDNLGVRCAR